MQADFRFTTRFRIAIARLAGITVAAAPMFESALIARVRIRSGDAALGSAADVTSGGTLDLVIMDDYILRERS